MGVAFRGQSEQANEDSNTWTFTVPSNAQAGDVAYTILQSNSGSTPITAPSGWTELNSQGSYSYNVTYHKVLVAGDPGSTITWAFVNPGTTYISGVMAVFSGANQTAPEDVTAYNFSSPNSTTITCPSVTTTQANDMLFIFGVVGGDVTFTGPSGWTAGPSTSKIGTYYQTQAAVGASGSLTFTQSSANDSATGTIAIQPAATAPSGYAWLNCV